MKRFLNQLSFRAKPKRKRGKRRTKNRISANSPEYQALFGSASSKRNSLAPPSREPQAQGAEEKSQDSRDFMIPFEAADCEGSQLEIDRANPFSENNAIPPSTSASGENDGELSNKDRKHSGRNVPDASRSISPCKNASDEPRLEERLAKLKTSALQNLSKALWKASREELRPKQKEILHKIVGELVQGGGDPIAPDFQSLLMAVEAEKEKRRSIDTLKVDLAS